MRTQSLKQTLTLSAILTGLYVAFVLLTSEDVSAVEMLVSVPLFFAILFFTMRLTNRVTAALASRFGPKPPPPPPPPEPTTDRPEHVQRRREARRRRSRRGSRRT